MPHHFFCLVGLEPPPGADQATGLLFYEYPSSQKGIENKISFISFTDDTFVLQGKL